MQMARTLMKPFAILMSCIFAAALSETRLWAQGGAELATVLAPVGATQLAPHGEGNAYAPEVMRVGDGLKMWFGAQGADGHDRIHLAESADGVEWRQAGVVLDNGSANHVNDPSVVLVNGKFFMYYTRANVGVTDVIDLAVSDDGVHWEPKGTVLNVGAAEAWDALAVGRPSVLYAAGKFHLWYDGRRDLPLGAPDPTAPQSASSQRHVGYATSDDGLHWRRHGATPVFDHDAGGVHVVKIGERFAMLFESHAGTLAAVSDNGIRWQPLGLLVERADEPRERFGHVTPFMLPHADGRGATLYYGAAAAPTWDRNAIASRELTPEQWNRLQSGE